MDVEVRTRDVIRDIFRELGQMSGFIPGIGPFRSQPLAIYNGESSGDTLQHITIFFVHEDGSLEKAGVLSPKVLFSRTRDGESKPILYFSLKLDFLRPFAGFASIRYGQEYMFEIIRRHFEALNDRSISVYFEHCNRFFYHKAALLAGSIPGWVSHRLGAGKSYRGLKGHLLSMMDRFLHRDNLSDIPREDLVKILAKVMLTHEGPTLAPRNWEEDRVTTLSFARLWNGNPRYEYLYDMEGKFWFESAPDESRQYIETAKKTHPERVINGEEVRAYLREYVKSIK